MAGDLVTVEIEHALGPGVEFESDGRFGLIGRRSRSYGVWLGFDRGAVVDSDDGRGRRVPVVVGVPGSTFGGARLTVRLTGGWRTAGAGTVLCAATPGLTPPPLALGRVAAGVGDEGAWIDCVTAEQVARDARRRYRERRSHARISGGRAWSGGLDLPPEAARYATAHSRAEYDLRRLPPRFVRGLQGLLDDDERILYWIERPVEREAGLVRRLRGALDRRAAVLLLSDRQVLWLIDHAQPDQYGSDWGLDVESIPVERVLEVADAEVPEACELSVATPSGVREFRLPQELGDEVAVMRRLIEKFTPGHAGSLPRRTYPVERDPVRPRRCGPLPPGSGCPGPVRSCRPRRRLAGRAIQPGPTRPAPV